MYLFIDIFTRYIYIYILAENQPYGRAFQLAPAEGINGAFGPIKFWGLRPQYLFIFESCKNNSYFVTFLFIL